MPEGWRKWLTPIGIWLYHRRLDASDKSVKQYYEALDRPSLIKDLISSLEALMGSQTQLRSIFKDYAVSDKDGELYWEEENFIKWITSQQQLPPVTSAITPRLWYVFLYVAGFPFTELDRCDSDSGSDSDFDATKRLNEDGFVQAYLVLALRGVELLGNTKDGWTPTGGCESSWSLKLPRLVGLLFDGLKVALPENNALSPSPGLVDTDPKVLSENQLMDAITLTQPAPYNTGVSFEKDLRDVVRRLFIDNIALKHDKPASFAVLRSDFQTLLQLCLLLRLGDRPLKQGLIKYEIRRLCSDIESLSLVVDEEEISVSARLSRALTKYKLGNVSSIDRQSFQAVCTVYPSLVLRCYELWTALLVPYTSSHTSQNLDPGRLSNCVAQILSLLGAAKLEKAPLAEWNEHERLFRLDLQNATIIAEFLSSDNVEEPLSPTLLVERLSNKKCFHFLLLSTEETPETGSATGANRSERSGSTESPESSEQLFALFTSPRKGEILYWDYPGVPSYVWRYGIVQLLPHILTPETGGLGVSFQDGDIKFSPHREQDHPQDHPQDHQSDSASIDLKSGIVVITMLNRPEQRLKLKSLKCYRMPGIAEKVYRYPDRYSEDENE